MTTPFEWGEELPTLPGTRVDLRPLAERDVPALFALFGDPEVMRFWSSPPLGDVAAAAALLRDVREAFAERRRFQWGITSRATGEVVGTCGLASLTHGHRRAEVGFVLRRDLWGQGLATEALRVMFGFAFRTLDLHRLEADVDPENERSLRVLERQGFRREGHLRERWHHLGEVRDATFLGLLRREWSEAP